MIAYFLNSPMWEKTNFKFLISSLKAFMVAPDNDNFIVFCLDYSRFIYENEKKYIKPAHNCVYNCDMKNFVFISPHFPDTYYKFVEGLAKNGFRVLGIGDCPYDQLSNELKAALTEYYACYNMENFEEEAKAVAYFENKYGHIDYLESNNEYWLQRDAWLRDRFHITTGVGGEEIKVYQHK